MTSTNIRSNRILSREKHA